MDRRKLGAQCRAALGSARRRERVRSARHAAGYAQLAAWLVVHLDVAALDVAGPGVERYRGPPLRSMEKPSPVNVAGSFVRPGSPWSKTRTVNRPGAADSRFVS